MGVWKRLLLVAVGFASHGKFSQALSILKQLRVGREMVILRQSDPKFSRVEDDPYESRLAEIEAMGGDPFFWSEEEDRKENDEKEKKDGVDSAADESAAPSISFMASLGAVNTITGDAVQRFSTDGLGPTPKRKESEPVDDDWEWDGVVDEDAHLGLD